MNKILVLTLAAMVALAGCAQQEISREEAIEIAEGYCAETANLTDQMAYNNNTRSWSILLDLEMPGCNPTCMVFENRTAEINYMCTGLIVDITEEEAIEIAESSDCIEAGNLTDRTMYNNNSMTWWIDLDTEKEGCAPACVVHNNGTAEVNWRCTGLIE